MRTPRSAACIALASAFLAGCGGSPATPDNGGVGTPSGTPTPVGSATPGGSSTGGTPTATPGPGVLAVSPSSLAFDTNASSATQTFIAIESGYSGAFTLTAAACTGIASVSGPGANATFSVTPLAPGTCILAISDARHQTANVAVSVTLTNATAMFRARGARP